MRQICMFTQSLTLVALSMYLYAEENGRTAGPLRTGGEVVSLQIASRVAQTAGQRLFNDVALGPAVVGCDLSGNARVYIFPCRIDGRKYPGEVTVRRELEEARQQIPMLQTELALRRETALNSRRSELKYEKMEGRYFLMKTPEWAAAERVLRLTLNECQGVGKYATIIVSAARDAQPIPSYSNMLPDYLLYADSARALAVQELGSSHVRVSCLYWGSDLEQVLEFTNESGEAARVALFPMRVVDLASFVEREVETTKESRAAIEKAWNDILKDVKHED